ERLGDDEVRARLDRPPGLLREHRADAPARLVVAGEDVGVREVACEERARLVRDLARELERAPVQRLEQVLLADDSHLLAVPVVRERLDNVRAGVDELAVQLAHDLGMVENAFGHEGACLHIAAALALEQVSLRAEDGTLVETLEEPGLHPATITGRGASSTVRPMRIAGVETRRYVFPFEPPLRVAWDPVPRTRQEATVVIVRSDDGLEGCASGDALPDRELLERLLVGVDPLRTEVVHELCETVDFHHARPWTAEAAVWDLVGRALETPCWRLLGGRSERLLAYASSAELLSVEERAARVLSLRDAGIRAVKIRFHHADWRDDVAVVEAVRDAVGPELEIMVDANQGWRMPGDLEPRWDVATAAQCARALEPLGVYWLEEPLPAEDVDGYRALRRRTDLRLAAGEMV